MNPPTIADLRILGPKHGYLTFVEVVASNGQVGIGATDAPRAIVTPIVEHGAVSLRGLILGEDPRNPRRLWRKMFVDWQARRGRGAEGGLAVNAMAMIDMAVWDLAGKLASKSVCQLLGGAVQQQVLAYASATLFTVAPNGRWQKKSRSQLIDECPAALAQGFQAIKFGWGNSFSKSDLTRLNAIREAIGPRTRLMLDFGCPAYWTPGWNAKTALRAARVLDDFDIYFLEEPLPPDDVDGFAKLTQSARVKIASGESLTTTAQFEAFIQRRALNVVQPDAQQIGVTQFHEVTQRAQRAGMQCVPHGPWTATNIGAHIQLLAAARNGDMIEYPCMQSLGWDKRCHREVSLNNFHVVEHPPELRNGFLQIPNRAGLGLGGFVHDAIDQLEHFYPAKRRIR